jgi:hypothetical protein
MPKAARKLKKEEEEESEEDVVDKKRKTRSSTKSKKVEDSDASDSDSDAPKKKKALNKKKPAKKVSDDESEGVENGASHSHDSLLNGLNLKGTSDSNQVLPQSKETQKELPLLFLKTRLNCVTPFKYVNSFCHILKLPKVGLRKSPYSPRSLSFQSHIRRSLFRSSHFRSNRHCRRSFYHRRERRRRGNFRICRRTSRKQS